VFFPEYLFQLSGRDQQVTWLDPYFDRQSVGTAGTSVGATSPVPTGRVLILQSAQGRFAPGAAQNVNTFRISLEPLTSQIPSLELVRSDIAGAANIVQNLAWSGSIAIPFGWTVRGLATFNAGVAVNTIVLSCVGILLPIGNIQTL
jgi:hypothetical protein